MELLSLVGTNLMRNKLRTILTTLSVFVALFLFVALHGLTDTLSDTIQVGSEQRIITRNKLSLVFPLPMSQLEQLRAMPGIKGVSWSNWFGGQDPVDPSNFYAQFAIDAKTYLPMYSSDLEIVDASPAPQGTPVATGVDPKLAAFMNERTACPDVRMARANGRASRMDARNAQPWGRAPQRSGRDVGREVAGVGACRRALRRAAPATGPARRTRNIPTLA